MTAPRNYQLEIKEPGLTSVEQSWKSSGLNPVLHVMLFL